MSPPRHRKVTRNSTKRWASHWVTGDEWRQRLSLLPISVRPAVASVVFYDQLNSIHKTEDEKREVSEALMDDVLAWRLQPDPDPAALEAGLVAVGYEPQQAKDRLKPYLEGNSSLLTINGRQGKTYVRKKDRK